MRRRSQAAALAAIVLLLVVAFACPAIAIYATKQAPDRFACALLIAFFVLSAGSRHGD